MGNAEYMGGDSCPILYSVSLYVSRVFLRSNNEDKRRWSIHS